MRFPKLLEPIIEDEADLVIGSRFLRKNVPKYRIFGQKVLSTFLQTSHPKQR